MFNPNAHCSRSPALLQVLEAPSSITRFQFHRPWMLAGHDGADCTLWSFALPQCEESTSPGEGSDLGGGAAERGRRKSSKPNEAKKQQTQYPKRTTR